MEVVNVKKEPKEIVNINPVTKEPVKKKCFIVGFAPSFVLVPWTDPDAEIWALNEFYKVVEINKIKDAAFDRWFEIHNPNSPSKNVPEHREWLKKCPAPIYMQKVDPEFPMAIEYPIEAITQIFDSKYFTNSISYMVALAILEKFEEIHIYGVDMACDSEYQAQRPSCEYWIGLAKGMGIKVFIPDTSDLLKSGGMYGYETDNQMRVKMKNRSKELDERIKAMTAEANKLRQGIANFEANINAALGAKEDIKFWLKNWLY
jgi:hypothetical protein